MCLNGCGRSGDVELGSGQGRLQHHTDPPQSCLQRALSCKQGPAQRIVGYSELEHITKFLIIKRLLASTQAPAQRPSHRGNTGCAH